MPLEIILCDFSQTNFSASRAAFLQAYRVFGRWQRYLMRRFHSPVYTWKVQTWIAQKKLQQRDDIFQHEWQSPPFPWVDKLAEAEAEGTMIDRGFTLFDDSLSGQNKSRTSFIVNKQTEIREAILAAKQLNDENPGANVPWQMFCGHLVPKPEAVKPEKPEAQKPVNKQQTTQSKRKAKR